MISRFGLRSAHWAIATSCLGAASTGWAQQVSPAISDAPAASSTNNSSAAAADSPTTGVQDIVVTAQRVGENLQKVPISVSAVNAKMVAAMGIKGSQDIGIAAPAVNFAETNAGANITIRGVGGSGSTVDEAANAVYIDGVYQAAAPGLVFSFNNIERIEVAKGPQGTLFGRNSTGGVIQIITRDPPSTPTADISLGYANYNTIEAQAYVGGALADNLNADLALYKQHQGDGWGRNVYTGLDAYKGKSFAGRSKLQYRDDLTKITLSLMHTDVRPPTSQGGSILPPQVSRSGGGVTGTPTPGFYDINHNYPDLKHVFQSQGALNIEHSFGAFDVVNIAAYTKTTLSFFQDVDIGPADLTDIYIKMPIKTFSEEFQIRSPAGSKIRWSTGFYFFKNTIRLWPFTVTGLNVGPGNFNTINSGSFTTSYAGYGQATVPIFSNTNFTAGLRYTADQKRLEATITTQRGPGAPITATKNDKKLTWRFSLDHQITPDVLLYASYNRGYKSGLYNIAVPTQPAVNPEVVDAYEGGFKSRLFDNMLRFNASAFYYIFKDIQVRTVNPQGSTILLNAASAHLKGVDVDITASPARDLNIQGAFSYLSGSYRNFGSVPFYRINPAGGLAQFTGNASGNNLIFSPKWVASLATSYKIPTAAGDFDLSGTVYYNGGFYFDPQNRVRQDQYALVNASVAWTPTGSGLEVRAWARNLTSRKYLSSVASGASGDEYYPGAPRTYGLTLRYRFN